jgi:hypothetical protein
MTVVPNALNASVLALNWDGFEQEPERRDCNGHETRGYKTFSFMIHIYCSILTSQ